MRLELRVGGECVSHSRPLLERHKPLFWAVGIPPVRYVTVLYRVRIFVIRIVAARACRSATSSIPGAFEAEGISGIVGLEHWGIWGVMVEYLGVHIV